MLADSIRRLHDYLETTFPYGFLITIADNDSTDGTWPLALGLSTDLPNVRAVRLEKRGKGRALRTVWAQSNADVVAYMDVDLSTDLNAFLPLIAPLLSGHSDLAIGTRLSRGSNVVRGAKREIISRSYNLLLRSTMGVRFSDAQCGFKAVRTDVAQALLPVVENEEWFFDTELLLMAEQLGLRIHEVPVDWVDDPDSRVDIRRAVSDDLRGMARVARKILSGAAHIPVPVSVQHARLPAGMAWQLASFAIIGVISTLVHLALYLFFRALMPPLAANAVAVLITAVANIAANRRFTFRVTGWARAVRHHLEGGVAFLISLVVSTGGLALLHLVVPAPSTHAELIAVVVANGLATLVRFLLLRTWVFNPRRAKQAAA
ncbi:sugar translocase [Planotetraspora thailandica]|uniref:Sugar translocase n=1 Tax=Planotetraspora thailandica TaxID=487172 RepID=A0A8J3V205_9ACTN|nr:sugar translocase [Planotetraspora thailandica]